MGYPAEQREARVTKFGAPYNHTFNNLAAEEGISVAILHSRRKHARRKERLLPNSVATHDGWSSAAKFTMVLEAALLTGEELAEYCRHRGLFPAQDDRWRASCEQANARSAEAAERHAEAAKADRLCIKEFERDLRRKDADPAETTALLVLREKVQAI